MKKLFFTIAVIALATCGMSLNAQNPNLEAIAQMRTNKADSLSTMMGKAYGMRNAINHPTAVERQEVLKGFNQALTVKEKDEDYKEGYNIANEFFKVSQDMKNRTGIEMSRIAYAQAALARFADTTVTKSINEEVKEINTQAKALIEELTALHKDSAAAVTKAELITLKSDTLSRNMGRFYGMHMSNVSNQKKRTQEQRTKMIQGFNDAINIDEANTALLDGKMMGSEMMTIAENIKRQLSLNFNNDLFAGAATSVLNDAKVPTQEELQAFDSEVKKFMQATQAFAVETSPEAMAQKGLGKEYIETLMEKDAAYLQTPSGLVYKFLKQGNGKKFTETDKIKVMYKGTHVDGKTFDESKEPITFAPNQVVPGFREALLMMSPGAKMIAVLPQDLAYGSRGAGKDIKPFETLVFEIETIGLDNGDAKVTDEKTEPAKKATKKSAATKKGKSKKATKKRK